MNAKDITLKRLKQYLLAEEKILLGQSYTIGDRQLTRADLKYVQAKIDDLLVALAVEDNSRGRTKRAVLFD